MRMRIIIIVNLILLIFLSCSSTITRRELTDISWIRNDSLLLEYQNYEDGNTFDVSDTLMNSSLVFVPFKMIVFLLFRTLYRDFVTERVTLWLILR